MRNNVPKSFFEVMKNDYNIYFNDDIFNTNALIIDYEDLKYIFNNFDLYKSRFDLFKEEDIQIYIKLDTLNLKKSYREIKKVIPDYISGFAIPHISKSLLNRMTIRARDYENTHKLNFGSIRFIAYIDSPEAVLKYRQISNYDRVYALYIDEEGYLEFLGLKNDQRNFLREEVYIASILSKKPVIDSYYENNENLSSDLIIGKQLGTISKLTKDLLQLQIINDFYKPSKEEVDAAKELYLDIQKDNKTKTKYSEYKIIHSGITLCRANELDPNLVIQNETYKNIKRPNKFYTFGEEIANAITHGIGILLAIVFLILLIIKGNGAGFLPNLAYIIYALSAFTLYTSSTLYHGLPMGTKAKNLFHKFDRMSIYLLIAGTYTPLTVISVGGNTGLILFIILWSCSAIGIFLNFYKFGKFQILHMFLYVFLGWIAIFYIKTIFTSLGPNASLLILLGGIAYTIGIIFYSTKLFKFTHMVWHLFTILGTVLHFIAIYLA